jgi:hypothetical protein
MSRTVYKSLLSSTIKSVHGVNARWLKSTQVQEVLNGHILWQDDVETFELIQHPEAKFCYAWSMKSADGIMVLTALSLDPVTSPQKAIHEAILQGKMNSKGTLLKI